MEESCSFGLSFVLFVFCLIVILVISNLGFEGRTLVQIASAPGHCLYFTFHIEFPVYQNRKQTIIPKEIMVKSFS